MVAKIKRELFLRVRVRRRVRVRVAALLGMKAELEGRQQRKVPG